MIMHDLSVAININYHLMQMFLPFHWPRAHHVTRKQLPTNNGVLMRNVVQLFFPVSSSIRAAILHECQNYLGGGGCLGGSEKNRGTVITSVQLAFRRRDRNFTPFFHSLIRKSASDEKHAKHISIYLACLQISPFETVILYSFWAIPPNKTLQACTGKTFS